MRPKKTVCLMLSELRDFIETVYLDKEDKKYILHELFSVQKASQRMEDRLYAYKNAIENLGFKRKK